MGKLTKYRRCVRRRIELNPKGRFASPLSSRRYARERVYETQMHGSCLSTGLREITLSPTCCLVTLSRGLEKQYRQGGDSVRRS